MPSAGDVTGWLRQLEAGDREAAQPLWERYFRRLVGLVRARLQGMPSTAADEEDVALSAFDRFCRGADSATPCISRRSWTRQSLLFARPSRSSPILPCLTTTSEPP